MHTERRSLELTRFETHENVTQGWVESSAHVDTRTTHVNNAHTMLPSLAVARSLLTKQVAGEVATRASFRLRPWMNVNTITSLGMRTKMQNIKMRTVSPPSAQLVMGAGASGALLLLHHYQRGTFASLFFPRTGYALQSTGEHATHLDLVAERSGCLVEAEREALAECTPRDEASDVFTLWELLKMAFMTVYVVPLRLVALVPCFVVAGVLGAVSARLSEGGWGRRLCLAGLRVCARAALFCCGFYWVRVRGRCADAGKQRGVCVCVCVCACTASLVLVSHVPHGRAPRIHTNTNRKPPNEHTHAHQRKHPPTIANEPT
jgi:hypothetical protein